MKNKNLAILIVDDEVDILNMFRDILQKDGWKVFTVPTGGSGLALAEREKLDIVLLDIRLPDISGIEVLKTIKKKYPDLPVIIITGFGYDSELVDEAVRLGASGYVSKSMPLREILETIDNVLTK